MKKNLARFAVFLLIAAGWEIFPRLGIVLPRSFPTLTGVLVTIADNRELAMHALVSAARAYGGLLAAVLAGLPLGLLLGGWFPRLQEALEPLMELFGQANPVILFHIVVLFFGIGTGAQIFIIAWLGIWPIAFSAINGIRTVDPQLLKTARSLGLGRWRLFKSVVLPAAAPSIVTGLRLAAGYSFIMLIAAEMMGTSKGIGYFMAVSQEQADVKGLVAAALIVTILGVATDAIIKQAGKRAVVRGYQGTEG